MAQMKPEILKHPNIPKPLHGMAPRAVKGKNWWDLKRQEAYARYDYHCVACGVHKSEAKKHKWLEAHEFWDIDYETGRCEVKSIEPLCHYCHNFIHSGRLFVLVQQGEIDEDEAIAILEHGFRILKANNLSAFPGTLKAARQLGANTYGVEGYRLPDPEDIANWEDFKMVLDGEEYSSKFRSYSEWEAFYNGTDER